MRMRRAAGEARETRSGEEVNLRTSAMGGGIGRDHNPRRKACRYGKSAANLGLRPGPRAALAQTARDLAMGRGTLRQRISDAMGVV